MMKELRFGLCAIAALALSVGANAATPEKAFADGDIVGGVDEAMLAQLALAEGHEIEELHPYEAPSVHGRTADGLLFLLIGTACGDDGQSDCRGILMQVRFDSDATVTTEGINQANVNEAAIASWWDKSENTVGFNRYVILDDGVTWANIRANLRILLAVYGGAADHIFH